MIANMGEILWWKYPDGGFEVHDNSDGKGPFLAYWNRHEPRPTEVELEVWAVQMAAEKKLAAIQAGKVAARDRGVEVNGVLFDSDLAARMAYNELAVRFQANPDFSTSWKASAGQWVTMDAALFAQVMAAGEAHIQACFTWQADREQEVAAAVATADLEAIKAVAEVME